MEATTLPHVAEPEYLTRAEAADLLRVDVQTVDRLARKGRLTRYRAPSGGDKGTRGRTLYRADEVRRVIEDSAEKGGEQ